VAAGANSDPEELPLTTRRVFLAQLGEDLVSRLSHSDTALDVIGSSGKLGGPGHFNITVKTVPQCGFCFFQPRPPCFLSIILIWRDHSPNPVIQSVHPTTEVFRRLQWGVKNVRAPSLQSSACSCNLRARRCGITTIWCDRDNRRVRINPFDWPSARFLRLMLWPPARRVRSRTVVHGRNGRPNEQARQARHAPQSFSTRKWLEKGE
jgi:hypothetical protein